jgi:citrate synthase
MADEITIIDEEMAKVIAKKLKAEKKEKDKENIKKQWYDFSDLYKEKSSDEILEILMTQYKFPTKL